MIAAEQTRDDHAREREEERGARRHLRRRVTGTGIGGLHCLIVGRVIVRPVGPTGGHRSLASATCGSGSSRARSSNARDGVLLVRNRRRGGWSDWSTPGGVIDDEDATLLAGLTREVEEETGLVVTAWEGPIYEVRAVAVDLGWSLRAEIHRAIEYEGELPGRGSGRHRGRGAVPPAG